MATPDLGIALLRHARGAIAEKFGHAARKEANATPAHEALERPGATFVTLTQDGELRGCIGTLEAHRSLYDDVTQNARAAAFGDPRFTPLAADELPAVGIEVSVLTVPQPLQFTSETDALRRLRPGVDGVIFQYGGRSATFLPQVWEQLPEPHEFMAHLKRKAGLPADFRADGVRLAVYQVDKYRADS